MLKLIYLCVKDIITILSQNNHDFGVKIALFGGEFRRVPPVIPNGSREEIVDECIKKCSWWSEVKVIKLSDMRAHFDQDYAKLIHDIGDDKLPRIGRDENSINIVTNLILNEIQLKNGYFFHI